MSNGGPEEDFDPFPDDDADEEGLEVGMKLPSLDPFLDGVGLGWPSRGSPRSALLPEALEVLRPKAGELPDKTEALLEGEARTRPGGTGEGAGDACLRCSSGDKAPGPDTPPPLMLLCSRLVLKARTNDFFPDLAEDEEEEPLPAGAVDDADAHAPSTVEANDAELSDGEEFGALAEDLTSQLPPRDSASERELLLALDALLVPPFLSLSLLKNLNLSNIEFLLPDEDEEVEGLDDELFDEDVEDVELALVRFDCLSPPDPGRPRPTGVGIPEVGAAPGEVARG